MRSFVIHRNIRRYQRLLEFEADETRRQTILDLLAEEEAKLAELTDMHNCQGGEARRSDPAS